jgi:hypothetical protein
VFQSNSVLETDRGAMTLAGGAVPSQPLADGSVYVAGVVRINPNTLRNAIFHVPEAGPVRVVAMHGDRAPGTPEGVTLTLGNEALIASNARGTLLIAAGLQGPGVDFGNGQALYLVRNGAMTLIARSSAGFPLDHSNILNSRCVNARDEVGIVTQYEAILYKPGYGTVRVARNGEAANPDLGLRGNYTQVLPFLGTVFGRTRDSGGDSIGITNLSEEGRLFAFGNLFDPNNRVGGAFAATFEFSGPGCPADFNMDGFADFFDYADFVECFEGGRCPDGKPADFNDDGIADFFDYLGFVEVFEAGC